MKVYFYIAIGGLLGAISRYTVKSVKIFEYKGDFPLNTLVVNVTGSFLLAVVLTMALNILKFNNDIKLGISVGFLGAYTTFSTLSKELTILLMSGKVGTALLYAVSSVILGLLSVYVGITSVHVLGKRIKRKEVENCPHTKR